MFMNTEIAVKQRAEQILKAKDLSVNLFAKSCGVSQQTLSDQFRGRCKLSYSTISALLEYFPDLSAEWLLRGEGEMLKADTTPIPLAEVTQELNSNNEEELVKLREQLDQQKEFNALQKEYVADLKERIKEYQDRVAELKDHIHELKKEQHSASVHRAKNA
jgi:transcriptional regulator with XRE-family HTH domain